MFANSGTCNTDAVTSFIQFGEQTLTTTDGEITANLSFDLDAGQAWQFDNDGGITFLQTGPFQPGFTGRFVFNGETLATGNLSANYNSESRIYNIVITALGVEPVTQDDPVDTEGVPKTTSEVPEPLTTLGTGLALGFGGLFQKNASKRKNQKQA